MEVLNQIKLYLETSPNYFDYVDVRSKIKPFVNMEDGIDELECIVNNYNHSREYLILAEIYCLFFNKYDKNFDISWCYDCKFEVCDGIKLDSVDKNMCLTVLNLKYDYIYLNDVKYDYHDWEAIQKFITDTIGINTNLDILKFFTDFFTRHLDDRKFLNLADRNLPLIRSKPDDSQN